MENRDNERPHGEDSDQEEEEEEDEEEGILEDNGTASENISLDEMNDI